jgi:hypothetical protein
MKTLEELYAELSIKKLEEKSFKPKKQLQNPDLIVESLINLRNELFEKNYSSGYNEVFLKINSCLYKTYPIFDRD